MPKTFKKLVFWNGRGWEGEGQHLCVCAHSMSHAVRLCSQAASKQRGFEWEQPISVYEIKQYWSKGWGKMMEGIEPEIGVWELEAERGYPEGNPKRLI